MMHVIQISNFMERLDSLWLAYGSFVDRCLCVLFGWGVVNLFALALQSCTEMLIPPKGETHGKIRKKHKSS